MRFTRTFGRALSYLPRYRRELLLGGLCLLPANALELAVPFLLARGIDLALQGAGTDAASMAPLWRLAGIVLVLVLVKSAFKFGMRWYIVMASRRLERDLRHDLFAKLHTLPAKFYAENSTGDLVSRMTADIEAVRMTMGPAMMYLGGTMCLAPVGLAIMLSLNPALCAWLFAPIALLSITVWRLNPMLQRASKRTQEAIARVSELATECFEGIRILKIFTREDVQKRRLRECGLEYLDAQMFFARARGTTQALIYGVKDIGHLTILVVGSLHLMEKRFSPGDFYLFHDLVVRMFFPMLMVGWVAALLHRGAAAMARIDAIFDLRPDIQDPPKPAALPRATATVEWCDVRVSYGDVVALDGVSLAVPDGGSLGITGRTGSGKSTLVHLLPRLFDPDEGVVKVGGVDVRTARLAELRQTVGVVPQEAFLFSATLRENLAYASGGEVEEEILEHAVFTAALDQDLIALPDRMHTEIGERGLTLSGGQRQRATLARCLAQSPPVLVLDDCLSAIDAHTEAAILSRLRETIRGRTTVVVSHRLHALRHLDQIAVLDQGRVVELGSHEQLLGRRGHYAELHRRQMLEGELRTL